MLSGCECEAESVALAVSPFALVEVLLAVGERAVSAGYCVVVERTAVRARRVAPCSAYERVGAPSAHDAVPERVVADALSAALSHAPLSGVHHAVAHVEHAVSVVLALLRAAIVCCSAVPDYRLAVVRNIIASAETE